MSDRSIQIAGLGLALVALALPSLLPTLPRWLAWLIFAGGCLLLLYGLVHDWIRRGFGWPALFERRDTLQMTAIRKILREAGDYFRAVQPPQPTTFHEKEAANMVVIGAFVDDAFDYRIQQEYEAFIKHTPGGKDFLPKLGDYLADLSTRLRPGHLRSDYDPPTSFAALAKQHGSSV
jgi:hypothetical protein